MLVTFLSYVRFEVQQLYQEITKSFYKNKKKTSSKRSHKKEHQKLFIYDYFGEF